MTLRARLSVLAAALALLTMTSPASADVSVVRVSSPSPFPIGDCRPDDAVLWDDGPGSESDPTVAINPTNPDNIVAAWVSDTGYGMVSASSFDGGQTWTRRPVQGFTVCTRGKENHITHARLSFGGDGRVYLTGETLHGYSPDPRSAINHIPVVTSTDSGVTWSAPSRVDDLPILGGFDRLAAEPDVPGAAVVVWHGPESAATSYLSRTTNGGRTWVKYELPNPKPEFQPFQSVLAAPDGALYVFYADQTLLATIGIVGDLLGLPLNVQTNLYVVRSDDKGRTWSAPRRVIKGVPADWVGTAAGPDGAVYVSTWRDTAQGRQLIALRSEDRGASWSAPSVIAGNVLAPFPTRAMSSQGTLGITYMTPDGDAMKAVFARSIDRGGSWTTEPVAGPFPAVAHGFFQETAAGSDGFASIFIREGPDTDGPTDVYVARIS